MVLFGTGSYIDAGDIIAPFVTQSFYGIWDKDDVTLPATASTPPVTRTKLQKQKTLAVTADGYSLQSNCQPQYESVAQLPKAGTGTATTLCPASLVPSLVSGKVEQQLGWVTDLNYQMSATPKGERYISNNPPHLASDLLTFKSLTTSGDPCNGKGVDFIYNLDYRTGGAYSLPVYVTISGTTATDLLKTFTVGAGSAQYYPSGNKLSTGNGQNPNFTRFTTDRGNANSSATIIGGKATYGACSNFVVGRPCAKDNYDVSPDGPRIKLPASGTVSWRQIP